MMYKNTYKEISGLIFSPEMCLFALIFLLSLQLLA